MCQLLQPIPTGLQKHTSHDNCSRISVRGIFLQELDEFHRVHHDIVQRKIFPVIIIAGDRSKGYTIPKISVLNLRKQCSSLLSVRKNRVIFLFARCGKPTDLTKSHSIPFRVQEQSYQTGDSVILRSLVKQYGPTRFVELVNNLILLLKRSLAFPKVVHLLVPELRVGVGTIQGGGLVHEQAQQSKTSCDHCALRK
jgi:hypothetical protein